MSDPESCSAARFVILAEASPGLLPRLLQPLAKRDLVPDLLNARREGETVVVEFAFRAIPSAVVHLIAGNLAQVVGVLRLSHAEVGRQAA